MASDWPEASEAAMAAQDALDDAAWFGGELMKRDAENARLQALLAERDAEIARLRPLAEYAQHDPGCYALHSRLGEAAACKCGFYEARAALAARGD